MPCLISTPLKEQHAMFYINEQLFFQVSHFYFTYHNNITFISEGVVHEIPLECQLFKDDRIIHYHNVDGRNELDDESCKSFMSCSY